MWPLKQVATAPGLLQESSKTMACSATCWTSGELHAGSLTTSTSVTSPLLLFTSSLPRRPCWAPSQQCLMSCCRCSRCRKWQSWCAAHWAACRLLQVRAWSCSNCRPSPGLWTAAFSPSLVSGFSSYSLSLHSALSPPKSFLLFLF